MPSLPRLAAYLFATAFIGFGINAILRPDNALSFLELSPATSPADKHLVEALMIIYGARDIFMGAAIYAAAFSGTRRSLGWTLIAASVVAMVDGAVCRVYSAGEWGHWSYGSVITLLGVFFVA
ncbi:hypothetical protein BJX96DRAFT_143937 [Aspergillus floccosus]